MIYEISINPVRLDRPSRRSAVRSWKALEGAGEFAETRWRGFGEQQIISPVEAVRGRNGKMDFLNPPKSYQKA
jgi:hypothetical protein